MSFFTIGRQWAERKALPEHTKGVANLTANPALQEQADATLAQIEALQLPSNSSIVSWLSPEQARGILNNMEAANDNRAPLAFAA